MKIPHVQRLLTAMAFTRISYSKIEISSGVVSLSAKTSEHKETP
jgi:hypothetical protein